MDSLISIGAVVATILGAVLLGLFVSSLNPTDPTVGVPTPTPSAEPVSTPVPPPSETPSPSPTVAPTPTPEALRGTLAFGTGLDGSGQITGETDTFTPADNFAYSLSIPDGLGNGEMRNEVSRTSDPPEVVIDDSIGADPNAETIAYNLGSAAGFIRDWGPGEYLWRIYAGEELVAEKAFRLAEG